MSFFSNGRLRLGVEIGWNPIEFTALGENFSGRGQRSHEQIQILKALWTQPHIKFSGKWHELPDVGLNPLPMQRPIPVWLGGHHENVHEWRDELSAWRRLGVGHVTLNTGYNGLHHKSISGISLKDHLDAIRQYHEATVDLL